MGEAKIYISDMFKENLNSFYYSVFESSLVGQIVVKEDTSLGSANKHMFKYFGMDSCFLQYKIVANINIIMLHPKIRKQ
jgi:hypothetical protein